MFFVLPFECTKDFHSFFHMCGVEENENSPEPNIFLICPFPECCLTAIRVAARASSSGYRSGRDGEARLREKGAAVLSQ